MCARFTVLSDTPIASAIAGCVIPLSRSSTIWMRWRCSARPFHRSAVFNRRTWPLEHLTICSLRIRWTKRITPRDPKTIHIPIFGPTPPQTFRFNQLWKWYENLFSERAKASNIGNKISDGFFGPNLLGIISTKDNSRNRNFDERRFHRGDCPTHARRIEDNSLFEVVIKVAFGQLAMRGMFSCSPELLVLILAHAPEHGSCDGSCWCDRR